MSAPAGPRRRGERGSATLEAVILVPGLVLVVACLVAGARVWFARAVVADAAQSAARAATLERSAGPAGVSARTVAAQALRTGGLACGAPRVDVDSSGFAVAVGSPASVRVEVACAVPLSDLFGLPVAGALPVSGSARSALDTYRARR